MDSPRVQLLGTGTAFHTDGRGSQSILVLPGRAGPFLVDIGPTAMAAIARFDVDYPRLDRLFLTHLHGDHTAGWPFLLLGFRFLARRTRPFDVYGPTGTRRCLEALGDACYPEILHHAALGFEIRYHELAVEESTLMDVAGMSFDVIPMEHHSSSIGYRFDLGPESVAVSGDTRWCASLEKLGATSDLLIAECTSRDEPVPGHVSLRDLRERIDRLGRCRVLLVHLTDEVAADLAANPLPRVTAGYDGMRLSVERAGP